MQGNSPSLQRVIERGPKYVLKIRLGEEAPERPRKALGNAHHVPVAMLCYTPPFLGEEQLSLRKSND